MASPILLRRQTPCRILLAEDNPADVRLVREALKAHGIDCALDIVADGEHAIDFIVKLDNDPLAAGFDLLLLDMHLPRRDGEDILKALRSTERYARTPVVVMTSSSSPHVRQTAEKHAALHYFRKPSSLAEFMELGAVVKEILGNKPEV